LEKRANIIGKVNGCPKKILLKMDTLYAKHSDSIHWNEKIRLIEEKINNNPSCK